MEKENSQLELFSTSFDSRITNIRKSRHFLSFIWNYEKIILIIISFIITATISFSLGVERGKKVTVLKTNSQLDIATKIPAPSRPKQIITQPQYQVPAEETGLEEKGYTIQVASFKTRNYAQREAQALTKKGFSALILSKGKYTILCVGNFSNKDVAVSLLSKLKKQYQDCFVRRL